MRVLITGASGHIASALIPELISAGHEVIGLARSDAAAATVRARGAQPQRGDLEDPESVAAAAREVDGVIHLAFDHAKQGAGDLAGAVASDLRAIEVIGSALAGSGKPFVGTNATGGLALAGFDGQLSENDTLPQGPRIDAENAVIALAGREVRSSVVRLPPSVHGFGRYGFVSGLIQIAENTGFSGYLAEGENRWPAAQVHDVARVYRLALESADAGTRMHAVAEEGIALHEIAETIAARLGIRSGPVAQTDTEQHFGYLSAFIGLDNPTSSELTRGLLDWHPVYPGLLAELTKDDGISAVAAE